MTHRIALVLLLLPALACNKDKEKSKTQAPEDAIAVEAGDDADVEPDVPQEPDPPEIEAASHEYMIGHYDETIAILTPVLADLEERKQYRASGLAAGWLALAHAEIVFEDAEVPAKHALAMAEKTKDPEVQSVAQLAHGAYLLGLEDFDAANLAFEAASTAAPQTKAGALANVLRAQTWISSAFGSGASDTLENPGHLEQAKTAYGAAAKAANAGVETDIILGRVAEGMGAIARYQGKTAEICPYAIEAVRRMRAAGASDFLIEGPMKFVQDFRCSV